MITCSNCGSDDIRQEVSIMVNPNTTTIDETKLLRDMNWEDYFYCEACQDECATDDDGYQP